MSFWESMAMALQSLKSNRTRSFLTMLGVIIGIAAVITMVSMGEGTKEYIVAQIQGFGMGSTTVAIHPGSQHTPGGMMGQTLSMDDYDLVLTHPKVTGATPFLFQAGDVKYGAKRHETQWLIGASAAYPDLINSPVAVGRFFTPAEDISYKKVVVLGDTVARDLFGSFPPVGERVKLNGKTFTVVGVMARKGSFVGMDFDDSALIPVHSAMELFNTNNILEVVFSVPSEKDIYQTVRDVESMMFKKHGKIEYHFHTQEEMMSIVGNIIGALTFVIAGIAMISLVVGGIGVMNIMLVSVTERTREIGIRKAVGARTQDIFYQFLIEAVVITSLGGVGGIVLGCLLAFTILKAMGLQFVIAWWSVIVATGVSALVGLFFGVYPARRAARLDPIEALRYE